MDARTLAGGATAAFDIYRYRPFIDGLRAVSIVAVVGYHAEVPGFSGGFIGVDVFFVISGFLIIGQILQGLDAGTFSFADFYARRVLRILPPLFLVLFVTLALAPLVMISPDQVRSFGVVGAHSAGMIANHYFAGHQGYFEQGAELNPLLHTWTLSVEEQFYLVAPLFLFALYAIATRARIAGRIVGIAFAVTFVASLVAGAGFLPVARADVFYLAVFRVWEFLAGGALGLLIPLAGRFSRSTLGWIAAIGLGVIVAAVTGFAMRADFPAYALLPVAGASAVLFSGSLRSDSAAAKLLATFPFVAVGRVSYGWYLWHWPLLVYARLLDFGELDLLSGLLVSAVSFGLAVATHLLVELPIKRWRRRLLPMRMRTGIIAAGCFGGALLAASYLFFAEIHAGGIEQARARTFDLGPNAPATRCRVSEAGVIPERCLRDHDGEPVSLLIGDSHARAFGPTLASLAAESAPGLVEILMPGCPPLADTALWVEGREKVDCGVIGPRIRRVMSSLPVGGVVVFARWNLYTGLGEDIGTDVPPRKRQFLGAAGGDVAADQFAFMAASLKSTLAELGDVRILLIAPTPEFPLDPRECLARTDWYRVSRDGCALPRTEVDRRREKSVGALQAVAASMPNVRVIDPIDLFCGDDGWCRAHDGNAIFFRDDDHLSSLGSKRLYDAFKDDFAWALDEASAASPP